MTTGPIDDILDDLFLGCALLAYLRTGHGFEQGWPD